MQDSSQDELLADYAGRVSIMLSYKQLKNMVILSELFSSLLSDTYQADNKWLGALESDSNMQDLMRNMIVHQIAVMSVNATQNSHETTHIFRDIYAHVHTGEEQEADGETSWSGTTEDGSSTLSSPSSPWDSTGADELDNILLALDGTTQGNTASGTPSSASRTQCLTSLFLASLLGVMCVVLGNRG